MSPNSSPSRLPQGLCSCSFCLEVVSFSQGGQPSLIILILPTQCPVTKALSVSPPCLVFIKALPNISYPLTRWLMIFFLSPTLQAESSLLFEAGTPAPGKAF